MKLYHSPASPFVRKVLIVAHEAGVADSIECLPSRANPVETDSEIACSNPLAQVPTALLTDGGTLHDSRVICEYLDSQAGAGLFPAGESRWEALTLQSLADGMLDAALLARYERIVRPQALQWDAWEDGQLRKIARSLDSLEQCVERLHARLDIGTIAVACALGYLDFRFPDYDWRHGRTGLARWFETFSQRPSMQATKPAG